MTPLYTPRRTIARLLITLAAAGVAAPSMAAPLADASGQSDAALVVAVKQVLNTSLGTDATDLAVTASHGMVTLHGWTKGPKQEAQALLVASKVPGVARAYSVVHLWSSTDEN